MDQTQSPAACAIVAGGTSGIGAALVNNLLSAGVQVYNLDRSQPDTLTPGYSTRLVDLCDPEAVDSAIREIASEGVRINQVAVVAGVGYTTPFDQLTPGDFAHQVHSNLGILFNVCRAVLPLISTPAAIVGVSSINAYGGAGGSVAYAAAKAGVVGLVRSLALEVAPRSIRVNAVVPGFVRTPLLDSLMTRTQRNLMASFTPLGLAEPGDIADVIQFLLQDQSRYMTGQAIVVDGGLSLAYRPSV